MVKRNETEHIRPCHIRESYRRRKLQGKVTQRTVPRLFRQESSDKSGSLIILLRFKTSTSKSNRNPSNNDLPNPESRRATETPKTEETSKKRQ
ncbi:hypothetical protein YC2023_004806 [Brassica napus]